jgi:hypothetical protein
MPYTDIGTVEGEDGNLIPVRWEPRTGVVQLHMYSFPLEGPPHREWMTIGMAKTQEGALTAAQIWTRG